MDVQIVDFPPARVACMRHVGPYGPAIGQLWRERFLPWRQAQGLAQAPCYGIGRDNPHDTPPERCRYDACVVVPADFTASGDVTLDELPGGRYAALAYRGDGTDMGAPWEALLREWLPASGLQFDARPFFEFYPVGTYYDPATGIFDCQLCVPVRPA